MGNPRLNHKILPKEYPTVFCFEHEEDSEGYCANCKTTDIAPGDEPSQYVDLYYSVSSHLTRTTT